MKQGDVSTKVAGIDVGKRHLDVSVHGAGDAIQVTNDVAGIEGLLTWLKARDVVRVGMEATGGYQQCVRQALGVAGFEVVVHQPAQVRAFAVFKGLKAKNDRKDAALIAAATAQSDAVLAANDPLIVELAERLTAYEQASERLAAQKIQMEHVTLKDLRRDLAGQIAQAERFKARLLERVATLIKSRPDLAERYRLALSLPGVGPVVAANLVVRMPELGAMKPGQAAALLGVAPFDRESGQHKGKRFITGGRSRPRRMLYIAALAARRCDPGFKTLAERLAAKGKAPKVILVAIMRKLIEAANLVLARGVAWDKTPPTRPTRGALMGPAPAGASA